MSAILGALAIACGVPVPGGPAGVTVCNLKNRPTSDDPRMRYTLGYAFSGTRISFSGATIDIERHSVVGVTEFQLRHDLALSVAVGATLDGTIRSPDARMGTGLVAASTVSYRLLSAQGARPFVLLTGTLSMSTAPTDLGTFTALDVRAGAVAGWTLFDVLTPYAVFRAFGGPVFWRGLVGSDIYHVQLGAGLLVAIPGTPFDVFVEGVPLGERGVSAGLGTSFGG